MLTTPTDTCRLLYKSENSFDLGRVNQEAHQCKGFEITYLREEDVSFEVGARGS